MALIKLTSVRIIFASSSSPTLTSLLMRLLVVEDSTRLRESIVLALRRSGYAVDATGDGREGLEMAEDHPYDAAILDVMLPSLDGLAILKTLRASGNRTPVMFLTARDAVADRVAGLRGGADDYLVKPFALEELLARVEALCRRGYQNAASEITLEDLTLDSAARKARRCGVTLDLTAREFALLEYLMLRAGQIVTRTQIEQHIYDDLVSPMSNVVDSAVCALRKKIAVRDDLAPLIHTRRGQGYVMEARRA